MVFHPLYKHTYWWRFQEFRQHFMPHFHQIHILRAAASLQQVSETYCSYFSVSAPTPFHYHSSRTVIHVNNSHFY